MPKSRKGGAVASATASSKYRELGRLFAATAALAEEDDDCSQDEPYYSGGFGTRRGTVCHCSRCLRRSGPLTEDPGLVEDEIAAFFDDVDPDGSCTGFEPGDLEEHHRVVAETVSLAVERGDVEVVKSILSNILDQIVQMELATRLVVPAAQHGHVSLIHLLDHFQADLEEPDRTRGGPPLMHAANNGHVGAVNALLELGVDPDVEDYQGQTALMVAVFSDRASAAEALLSRGASVDAVDLKGRSALSHAACYGSLDCISVLAQHNADVFHVDADGRTPLDTAEDCSRLEAAAQLKRLQQRQRLRMRKGSRQRDVAASHPLNRLELMQKEAEALKHALALVEEEEFEAQQKARKQKAKKPKKKGKAVGPQPVADNVWENGERSETPSCLAAEGGEPEEQEWPGRNTRQGTGSVRHAEASISCDSLRDGLGNDAKAQQKLQQQSNSAVSSSRGQSEDADVPEASAGTSAPSSDPIAEMRKSWDELLKEAAGCKDVQRQVELVELVRSRAEACAAAGISVKYGKKVLGKLEKAPPVREALSQALQKRQPSLEQLETAVEQARGLRSLLDDALLAEAEAKLKKLSLEYEAHKARLAAARPKSAPAEPNSGGAVQMQRPLAHSEKPQEAEARASEPRPRQAASAQTPGKGNKPDGTSPRGRCSPSLMETILRVVNEQEREENERAASSSAQTISELERKPPSKQPIVNGSKPSQPASRQALRAESGLSSTVPAQAKTGQAVNAAPAPAQQRSCLPKKNAPASSCKIDYR